MSIHCLSRVWENSKAKGGNLLVLLALADIAKPSGYCWPSYSYIAKMSRLSDRQVIRIVSQLVETGELIKIKSDRKKSNEYIVWVWKDEPELKKCTACGKYEIPELETLEAHHIVPISKGGEDTSDNLTILCQPCHIEKHKEMTASDKMSHAIKDTPIYDTHVTPPVTPMSHEPVLNRNINLKDIEEEGENIFSVYEQEIGSLTPHISNELILLEEEHTTSWVCKALKECSERGKRSLGYSKAILNRWRTDGYGTAPPWERKDPSTELASLAALKKYAETHDVE